MVEIIRITFTVINYVTEDEELVIQGLRSCVPQDLTIDITRQLLYSQFNDKMVLLTLTLSKVNEIQEGLNWLSTNLDDKSKSYLFRYLEKKLDLDERVIHIRLDKFKAVDKIIRITEGSDVIKVVISYSAYTQEENTLENVTTLLLKHNLIQTGDI
ncbi:MAG: hypothetical protein OEZ01_07685 [Candidatus Heimdallarchaeota archaeon]|nr:hypothetical protein [Candidatus Heimdallarchaeota archaeon]MDH5645873.1 hypothetical protein [Candidatus Heimdallarchaeota archaeon]